jgi:hypothetical protein
MKSPIKIAGIGCSWDFSYALLYKDKLCEVGYCAKILYVKEAHHVAYCYREFTSSEAESLIIDIFRKEEKNDTV